MKDNPQLPLVLVVEDSEPSRKIITSIILKMDYRVATVLDGVSALDFLKNEPILPTLILSDIMMPNMNGLELLRHIRQNPAWNDIKFVFTTAAQEKEMVVEAKQLGVQGYILKPVTYDRIQKKIFELYPEKKAQRFKKIA